ncbi:MAG: CoA-binding protein [Bacteroidetes bacterium]|nr:CoA-binding protein [Bacteroidota bacterium]
MNTKEILQKYKTIAVVGYSDNPDRDSHGISDFMNSHGYTVYGVNPRLAGKTIDGIKCFASLKDIPYKINIVNIFRRSEAVKGIVGEVLNMDEKPEVIWAQLGVISPEAGKLAEDNGFVYIENKCIYVEHKLNHIN